MQVRAKWAALGDKPAFIDAFTGDTRSFAQMNSDLDAMSGTLRQLGVEPGHVVAVIANNSVDYCTAVLAVVNVGAVVRNCRLRIVFFLLFPAV